MKDTGIVRMIDDLGRIVIPKELRRTLDIKTGEQMEIFVDGEDVVIRKYQPDTNTKTDYESALIMVCNETGKDPVDYLHKVKSGQVVAERK